MRLNPRVALLSDVQGKFGDRFVVGRINNEERIVLTEQRVEVFYLRAMLVEDFLQRIDAIWALLDVLNPLVRGETASRTRPSLFPPGMYSRPISLLLPCQA